MQDINAAKYHIISRLNKCTSLKIETGQIKSDRLLGVMYQNGDGVTQDYGEALKWYRLAAEQGNVDAQLTLGFMYKDGFGVTRDLGEALKRYRLAANQGHLESIAMVQKLERKLAPKERGEKTDPETQYDTGLKYFLGEGVARDYNEAVKWFRLAAEQGHRDAQQDLADMYTNGHGVPQDYGEAFKWFRLAAEQGDEGAKKRLLELETISPQKDHQSKKKPSQAKPTHLDAKSSDTRLNEIVGELNKLIGLGRVKKEIYQLMQVVRVREMKAKKGLKTDGMTLHSVFLGSPGTGKTTVARLYGQMLKSLGLLSKGHLVETDRSGLVAGYIGQTEIKTDEKIKEALGGLLFIDEAYSLNKGEDSQSDYGNEAISILLKRMEDYRDDFVVIVAGYDNPMEKFLRSNEGLKSRFSRHIHFDDFSADELVEIFQLLCKEGGCEIGSDALESIRTLVSKAYSRRMKVLETPDMFETFSKMS